MKQKLISIIFFIFVLFINNKTHAVCVAKPCRSFSYTLNNESKNDKKNKEELHTSNCLETGYCHMVNQKCAKSLNTDASKEAYKKTQIFCNSALTEQDCGQEENKKICLWQTTMLNK